MTWCQTSILTMYSFFILYMILVTDTVSQPLTDKENSLFGLCSGVDHQLLQIQRIENAELRKQVSGYDSKLYDLQHQIEYVTEKLDNLSDRYDKLNALFVDLETGVSKPIGTSPPDQPTEPRSDTAGQNTEPRLPIAFYAAVSVDTETNPVVFDKIYINEGGCYENTTGEFTCSVSGVYHITWSVETFGEEDVGSILEVNGEEFGYTWTDSQDQQYDTSTGVAILRLNAGDVIKVTLQSGSKVDARQSVFTGHYLFP